MSYAGPISVVRGDVSLFCKLEDTLLEAQLAITSAHGGDYADVVVIDLRFRG